MDDESKFLTDLQEADPSAVGIDLKIFLATSENHLLEWLNTLKRDEDWEPDLLCLDLNEASGKGVAGLNYLALLRAEDAHAQLPVVLTTKDENPGLNEDGKPEDLFHNIFQMGADGYVPGKVSSRAFLKLLNSQSHSWRLQARQRVWQGILNDSSQVLAHAGTVDGVHQELERIFKKLATQLGIDHAFARRGPPHKCPIWARHNGPWASKDPVEDLSRISLMQDVITAAGKVVRDDQLSAHLCGPFRELVGKSYLGAALMLHDEFLGVMTVVCDQAKQFGPLDAGYFQRLAEMVGNALGTLALEERRQTMRDRLLDFSQGLAAAVDDRDVCGALARAAHEVLNVGVENAKCTVRLVAPGMPVLRRYGEAGRVGRGSDIDLKFSAKHCMFERAFRSVGVLKGSTRTELDELGYLDNNIDPDGKHGWWRTESAITVPLALMRPDGRLGALGAMNLECSQPRHYDTPEVRPFLEVLTLTATQQLTALRSARFGERALDLAVKAYSATPEILWRQLDETLFTLLGHNLMVQLDPPIGWDRHDTETPWEVRRVFSRDRQLASTESTQWQEHFNEKWAKTFTAKSLKTYLDSPEPKPLFTADAMAVIQPHQLLKAEVEADAVLPLIQTDQSQRNTLGGLLLLTWFSPPVMDQGTFDGVLTRFATYGALLLQHSTDRMTGEQRLQMAEKQAAVAFAAQQFEHVLNNRLATMSGHITLGLQAEQLPAALAALEAADGDLQRLTRRSKLASRYMRPPIPAPVRYDAVWNEVCGELQDRAEATGAKIHSWGEGPSSTCKNLDPNSLKVRADTVYLWNALYILVDNAMQAGARDIWCTWHLGFGAGAGRLSVHDNGHGVTHPDKLFQYGYSTKSDGQGIGLALAKDRLHQLGIQLEFDGNQPDTRFSIQFEANEERT